MTIKKSNNENNFRNHFTSVFRCVLCVSTSIHVHHSIAIKKLLLYYTARYWFLMLKLIIVNLNARISLEIVFIAHPWNPIYTVLFIIIIINIIIF